MIIQEMFQSADGRRGRVCVDRAGYHYRRVRGNILQRSTTGLVDALWFTVSEQIIDMKWQVEWAGTE